MKYKDLLKELKKMSEQQLDMDVTIFLTEEDEYCEVFGEVYYANEETEDVLDKGHPYIAV